MQYQNILKFPAAIPAKAIFAWCATFVLFHFNLEELLCILKCLAFQAPDFGNISH